YLHPSVTTQATQLYQTIVSTLSEDPPFDIKNGQVIRPGINEELDQLRHTALDVQQTVSSLEATERQRTKIQSLKIKFNQVFGYYIEISNANLHLAPAEYFRKQTLVNAERFTTEELKKLEIKILTAEEQIHLLEERLFLELLQKVTDQTAVVQLLSHALAELDCEVAFAEIAHEREYCRPTLTNSTKLELFNSRHPVVEQLLDGHAFVPNTVTLDSSSERILLLTGPNMAGKSVLMRQIALITLMSHIGSFVPAEAATIPITDKIFVRSGAADIIAAGLSTFMVEMVETAAILKNATPQSLIIMDEIGRGTSTFDGISLAWAIAEHLADWGEVGPKTLFATHYHELQALSDSYPTIIANYHLAVTQHQNKPVFLYTLKRGAASHSFGIAVATLAGLPSVLLTRASSILDEIESGVWQSKKSVQLSSKVTRAQPSELEEKLRAVTIPTLTPLEALNIVAQWQQEMQHDKD
ncbi:MAG: DNA mismatch repair protein MutS, partial [bacterium]|nr:DNA mismatch repair protein MutS [bacterium]